MHEGDGTKYKYRLEIKGMETKRIKNKEEEGKEAKKEGMRLEERRRGEQRRRRESNQIKKTTRAGKHSRFGMRKLK